MLSIQCYDITSYRAVDKEDSKPYIATREKLMTRKRNKKIVDYVEEWAVRYKMQKVIETQKKKVPVIKYKEVTRKKEVEVPVPIVSGPTEDCCGAIDDIPNNTVDCKCAPQMEFMTKKVWKNVTEKVPYTDYKMEDCEVEVMKRVPYKVKVNKPVVKYIQEDEPYTVVEEYIATNKRKYQEIVPIVIRQCKDAHGKILDVEFKEVPLYASGPTKNQLNIDGMSADKELTVDDLAKPELREDDVLPGSEEAQKAVLTKMNRDATLVVAPLDDVNSEVGFIQVGGINARGYMTLHEKAPVG